MNFEIFKKHPYITGGGLLAVFVLIYFLRSRGGSSSTGVSASGTSTNAYDVQLAQLDAAQNQQQMQYQATIQGQQLQAQVQQQAIQASQDVTKYQTDAQLQAALAQLNAQTAVTQSTNDTQVKLAQTQADVYTAQINQQTAEKQAVLDYLNNQTNAQAQVATAQIGAQSQAYQAALKAKQASDAAVLSTLPGIKNSQLRAGIVATVASGGNPSAAVASQQGVTYNTVSGQAMIGSIFSGASSALAALLA